MPVLEEKGRQRSNCDTSDDSVLMMVALHTETLGRQGPIFRGPVSEEPCSSRQVRSRYRMLCESQLRGSITPYGWSPCHQYPNQLYEPVARLLSVATYSKVAYPTNSSAKPHRGTKDRPAHPACTLESHDSAMRREDLFGLRKNVVNGKYHVKTHASDTLDTPDHCSTSET